MSLLDQYKETFLIMNKSRTADGAGGYTVTWKDGDPIDLVLRFDSSMEARKAEKDGVTSVYTFLGPKDSGLEYHDVLKRESDGMIFRITSIPGESKSPASASFSLISFTAERWALT